MNFKDFFKRIDWPTSLFLSGVTLVAVICVPVYLYVAGWHWSTWVFAFLFSAATEVSITGGYHRLFSHRSYEAHPLLRWLYVLVGSSAWQGSVIDWCSDHRQHHRHIDTKMDPYNIKQGFWYAHMGWLFIRRESERAPVPDLEKDWLIRMQHRHYVWFAIATGFLFPAAFGALIGDFWGGFLIAGVLRIVLTQHATWFVNSLSHTLGGKPYAEEISARDSWFVALVTYGEGYHNFHHKFEADYRNGISWWHWDPTKWTIWSLSKMGLARRLRKISNEEILKARLQVEALRLKAKGLSDDKLDQLRDTIVQAATRLRELRQEYRSVSQERLAQLKIEIELTRIEFRYALKQWKTYLRAPVVC